MATIKNFNAPPNNNGINTTSYIQKIIDRVKQTSVKLNEVADGNFSFQGTKTFVDLPKCYVTPTLSQDLVNKNYVDSQVAGGPLTWSNYPAIRNVDFDGYALGGVDGNIINTNGFGTMTFGQAPYTSGSTRISQYGVTATVGSVYAFFNRLGPQHCTNIQFIDNTTQTTAANTANWATFPAVSNVDIDSRDITNVNSLSLGSMNLSGETIQGTSNLRLDSTNLILTAGDTINLSSSSVMSINGSDINLNAETSLNLSSNTLVTFISNYIMSMTAGSFLNISASKSVQVNASEGIILNGGTNGITVQSLGDINMSANNAFSVVSAKEIILDAGTGIYLYKDVLCENSLTADGISTGSSTVDSLPPASEVPIGQRRFVTDARGVIVFMSNAVGDGTTGAPVFSDGTNWRYG
jgi:hypothetical protein